MKSGRPRLRVRELVVAAVVALISCGLILVGGLGDETLARIDRQVEVEWRPAYDLLVLPEREEVSLDVGGVRVTEANFMGGLSGGIRVEQWRRIKRIPDVDVAAPLAPVGYFLRNLPQYRLPTLRPGFFEVDRVVRWDNGADVRVQKASTANSPWETRGGRDLPCSPDTHLHLTPRGQVSSPESYRRARRDLLASGFRPEELRYYTEDGSAWICQGLDPGGVFSVYGIDPVQEARLVGLDDATRGRYLSATDGFERSSLSHFCFGRGCKAIRTLPLMVNRQGWLRTTFDISYRRYRIRDLPSGELADLAGPCPGRLRERVAGETVCYSPNLRRRFATAGTETVVDARLPINDSRFGGRMIYRDGRWRRTDSELSAADQKYAARPTRVGYRRVHGPDGPWLGSVEAIPSGSYGPEPTFRHQLVPRRFPIVQYQINGYFDGTRIAERFSGRGNWLPEDTYRPPHAVLRFDDRGTVVAATELRPTANPLGYLLDPPRALTTIRAARALLGDSPIAAVRVRVEGVEEPGEAAWTRVENVARRIEQHTGLRPIVMLGASPARVLVRVPGIDRADQEDHQSWRLPNFASETLSGRGRYAAPTPSRSVRGFGWVEEPWLREGAAISYLRSGATQHAWLLILLGASCTIYLIAAFASLALNDIKPNAIRRAVGWQRSEIFRLELRRALSLGAAGAVAGALLGLAAALSADLRLDLWLSLASAPAAIALAGLAAILPAWRSSQIPAARVLAGGELALSETTHRRRWLARGLFSLVLVELTRLRARTFLSIGAGAVATAGLFLLVVVRTEYGGSLQVTVLGQAIILDTGPLQTAVLIVAIALAAALLSEMLWQSVVDRRPQIGVLRAVGWSRNQVALLYIAQGLVLGLISAAGGALVSGGIVMAIFGADALDLLGNGIAACFLGGALLGVVAAGVPARRATRFSPVEVLRAT